MTVQHTATPARTDLDRVPASPRSEESPTPAPRPFLWHGSALTLGALSWSAGIFAFGPNPHDPAAVAVFAVCSGLFQLGLLCLLRVLWRTRALGSGRLARTALRVETVLVVLAIASTTVDGIGVSDLSQPGWLALDAFWPLSMLGMFAIGIRIAVAGRWHGPARFWPVVAESWAVVTVPTMMLLGEGAATVVGGLHLLVGYAVLGQLVAHKVVADERR
jgi:hypothetical protein